MSSKRSRLEHSRRMVARITKLVFALVRLVVITTTLVTQTHALGVVVKAMISAVFRTLR